MHRAVIKSNRSKKKQLGGGVSVNKITAMTWVSLKRHLHRQLLSVAVTDRLVTELVKLSPNRPIVLPNRPNRSPNRPALSPNRLVTELVS